ncbi:Pectin acetylesterase 9 [Holothuria leucospilota]|uniref:Pectin acetylesterase 9 n=1 Tax=Holothuria leucospilota TaxID=206669 RepID=A0A9Q1HL08_HOLLE|nr:Pectin acetylesterase 9 [Holothuria leucospilota]
MNSSFVDNVRYFRLPTDGKAKVRFEKREGLCRRMASAVDSVCIWPVYAALLLLLWVTWFLIWISASALVISSIGKNLTLVRIPTSVADQVAAYCLDGSDPAYYFRRGKTKKWIIHFPSSELCFSLEQCMRQSDTVSGSTRTIVNSVAANGVLSPDSDLNPDFYDWNVVSLYGCDGGLYTGNEYAEAPSVFNEVYFRGFHILKCVLHWLLDRGLYDAEEVLVTGTGTGAQAVYLHLDFIKESLPFSTSVRGLADSGFIADILNRTNFPQIRTAMQHLYATHKSGKSLDDDCIKAKSPQGENWQCLLPDDSYKFISTPLFVVDSFYNSWSLWFVYNFRCYPNSCQKDIPDLTWYGEEINKRLQQVYQSKRNGAYVTSCFENDFILHNGTWNNPLINGTVLREAFYKWYQWVEEGPGETWTTIGCSSHYSCNPSCDWSPGHFLETTEKFRSQAEFFKAKQ